MSHLNIVLDLQILNRSTHLVFHPNYKGGEISLSSLFSTSVTSKHEFRNVFTFNCTRKTILIPSGYVLYNVNGLLNFPNEKGEILTIQDLSEIVPLSSELPLFTAQSSQLLQEKEMAFVLTCQDYLCSTYRLFHPESRIQKQDCVLDSPQRPPTLFSAFPITNAPCLPDHLR